MSAELTPTPEKKRTFSLSIGQLTFGSFLLVLAVIIVTATASVIAIRHIDTTFAELQRLQSVGDLAEDIDRRMNELRLAARDFVTDPGAHQFKQVGEAASTLSDILRKTRLELAPEQQDMIDGVTERLATYRNGIERISTLIDRRAELLAGAAAAARPVRRGGRRAAADRELAARLSERRAGSRSALLARNPSAAEQAAQGMRAMDDRRSEAGDGRRTTMPRPSSRSPVRERQIAEIDREVLGTEGRLIGRVTELLREVSARRGHVLSRDFARTLTEARWQSIVLGTIGVLIGILAARLRGAADRAAAGDDRELDPRARRRREGHLDPGDRPRQRDRRHRARGRSVPPHAGRGRHGARGGGAGAHRAAAGRRELPQTVRGLGRRHLRHDAGRRSPQRQSGAGADDGL